MLAIFASLVLNGEWLLHSSLDMGMFLRRGHLVFIIEKKISKSHSQIMCMPGNLTLVQTREFMHPAPSLRTVFAMCIAKAKLGLLGRELI